MKTKLFLTALLLSTNANSRPLDKLKMQSFEKLQAFYLHFSDPQALEKSFSTEELVLLKNAHYEIAAFKTPPLSKVSTIDQKMEFSWEDRKYSLQFREDGTAQINGKAADVRPYRNPVERLKYIERVLQNKASLSSPFQLLLGSTAYAATGNPSVLIERLVESWNKESKKWIGARLYDQYVKKDGLASLDAETISSVKQLFAAKDLIGIDVNCNSAPEDLYSTSLREEGGENWICSGTETAVTNKSLQPQSVTLYHEDGSISQVTVGTQHPASICSAITSKKMPTVGSVVKVKNGVVSSESIARFSRKDAAKLQDKALLPEERAMAAVAMCCAGADSKKGNCFDQMVTAAEKSKLTNKGSARETLKGSTQEGVR